MEATADRLPSIREGELGVVALGERHTPGLQGDRRRGKSLLHLPPWQQVLD